MDDETDQSGETDRISDRMESVSTLATGVAHEINNPLAFIAANLEMIAEELQAPHHERRVSDIVSMVEEARYGCDRIKKIVRGLMTFSRSDDDSRASLDVGRLIEIALDMTRNDIQPRARVMTAIAPLPPVVANETRLCQVFVNLLMNAVESIPPGQPETNKIEVVTRTDATGAAVIEIRDTGSGVAPEIRSRIFDPFFTTKMVGEGTGLGLSICHNIVRSLGGEITFDSDATGTTFRVTLPASEIPPAPRFRHSSPVIEHQQGTVLVVDDEVIFANSIRRLLSRNHAVTVVHSGLEALDRLKAGQRFDVIVCDLMMPGLTGMELHRVVCELDVEQARRMVFLTGGAFTSESQRFLEHLSNPWLEKPCDLEELRALVRRLVR